MSDLVAEQNFTDPDSVHWIEDSSKISLLFSAVAIGSIIGTFPIMWSISKFGVRKTFVGYGLVSGLGTILLPLSTNIGFVAVFICRVMQGFAQSVIFSVLGAIAERWSPIAEAGTFISVLSGCLQLASVITMPVAALTCESSLTWRLLYYIQGILTFMLFALFYLFYANHPQAHRKVSHKELSRITLNKPPVVKKATPYWAICKDKAILGVWLSCTGANLAFLTLLLYGPTYMNKALNLDVKSTGFQTALPYILALAFKFVAGPISDKSTCISERARILLFAVLSQGMVAISFVVMAITSSSILARIFYTTTIVFSGVNVIGVLKCAQLVARQYVHFVFMFASFSMCVLNFLLPIAVAIVCPNNEIHEIYMRISDIKSIDDYEKPSVKNAFYFFNYTRYVIMILVLLCLTALQSNSITLNFTVICMQDIIPMNSDKHYNSSHHWLEKPSKISILFSAIAFGALLGIIPIVHLFHKFGLRNTFVAYGILSAISTLLVPLAVKIGFIAVVVIRVLQGVGQSVVFSITGAVSDKWSPRTELGIYISIFVSKSEAEIINEGKNAISHLKGKVPFTAILKDPTVWGCWGAITSGHLGYLTLAIYGPIFLNQTLNFDVATTGFVTTLPYAIALIAKLFVGFLSDQMSCISQKGFGQAVVFSIQGSVVEKWSTISGMGLFLSVLAAYIQTAPTLTMPLAAFCCESSLTWRALYYINALITLTLFVVFFLFYTDSPEDNRFVSEAELKLIKTGKHPTVRSKVPYKAILKDPSVWSSLLGIFSGVLGAVFLIIFGPTYLNKALNFDVKSTGIATALPFFLALFGKLGVGHISDKLTFMSAKVGTLENC
ncbi:hypothetical protein WR25_22211 isoform E [Diploscapter pachys]|uniref:Major facilitator superfamily (MFS) profile domain-containing protein n=1 Tax=Diploscapter pachys TaxID=2018661 RepID=A0A2A2KRV6_9BILA|nr:hypothetical protein WR25_22211 isoform B [Diploscapter pachys]PAV76682.1 hypothetical protein WR25_22211 isoform E [Diploscapter pachys]